MDLDLLAELASYARVATIPWAELRARGQGLVESNEYIRLLTNKRIEFDQLRQTLDITNDEYANATTADIAAEAWDALVEATTKFGDTYLESLKQGNLSVAWAAAIAVNEGALRTLFVIVNAVNTEAELFHSIGMAREAVVAGVLPLEEAEADASDTLGLWDAMLLLDRWGAFDSMKEAQPTKGIGQWQRAIIWATATVAIAAVLAYAGYKSYESSQRGPERESWAEKTCYDANHKLIDPLPKPCEEYFHALAGGGAPSADFAALLGGIGKGAKNLGTGIAWAVGVGVFVYVVGVHVVPALLRELRGASRAPRQLEA